MSQFGVIPEPSIFWRYNWVYSDNVLYTTNMRQFGVFPEPSIFWRQNWVYSDNALYTTNMRQFGVFPEPSIFWRHNSCNASSDRKMNYRKFDLLRWGFPEAILTLTCIYCRMAHKRWGYSEHILNINRKRSATSPRGWVAVTPGQVIRDITVLATTLLSSKASGFQSPWPHLVGVNYIEQPWEPIEHRCWFNINIL